ncbi:hypothetical protein [Ekhidna sp.]|uniref:hypothetical protein n=1 Tax=Ekhidna sp. TaxID=2608089 RepID=UPI0032F00965
MTLKNNLENILDQMGIMPTKEQIDRMGFTSNRFTQILKNSPKSKDVTVVEKENIEDWLSSITNTPVDIFEDSPEDLKRKHNLIKA